MKNEKSLKDTIYNAILEDMFSLEYKPGDILNENGYIQELMIGSQKEFAGTDKLFLQH